MTLRSLVRAAVNVPLRWAGAELVRAGAPPGGAPSLRHAMPTCASRLEHARGLGFAPDVIVDGGAFKGSFSLDCARLFLVAIEPNPHVQGPLTEALRGVEPPPHQCAAALADHEGEAVFHIWGDPDAATSASLLTNVRGEAAGVSVPVETLDGLLDRLGLRPDLVKLDLQGAEGAAIRGGQRALEHAELAVVEFGCLDAYEGRTTPRELMDRLYALDFVLYDVVDCHYRPYDGALTGGDFFFVKRSSPLRRHKGWS